MAAAASAAEPFSIRGFAARMRVVDAAKCWPFGGGGDGEPGTLPLMDPPPRSRWWAHELAALRAPQVVGARGCDAAVDGNEGGGLGKATKRKGSCGSDAAERDKKRQRVLQFSFFLKHKEGKSMSRSLQHQVFDKGLLRRRKRCTIHTLRELSARKKSQEMHVHSLKKQCRRATYHKQRRKVSRSTNYPLNPKGEVGKHVAHPIKDDIFGDLPLLESSKILFHTGVDILPTVIEDSFVTNQSGPDATISETACLRLMPASDITKQTPSPLRDIVKKEETPDKDSTCISLNDAARRHSSSTEFGGPQNHRSINVMKTCLGEMQQKSTDVPALSCYSGERSKSCLRSLSQDCFYTNTNFCRETKEPGTSSAISSTAVRTRTEATKMARDSAADGKRSPDIFGRLAPTKYHFSSEGSVLPLGILQGTVSAGSNACMSSCRSMPSQEYVPTSSPVGKFASNVSHESRKSVDTLTSISMEDQGSGYSKIHPARTPASIGMAFMKLPGLERVEISSCNLRTDEGRFLNGRSMGTVRFQKEQLVSGMTNVMHGQNKIGFSDPQAEEKGPDGYVRQDIFRPHEPTVRLMGKTVSVFKGNKDQKLSTVGRGWAEHSIIEEGSLSSIPCQLSQKRLFPRQDSVIPIAHVTGSSDMLPRIPKSTLSDMLPRIPKSTLSEARSSISDVQNQRPQHINNASSTVKDWNSGSQFVRRAEVNKACIVGANSSTRHMELHQLPQVITIPRYQHSHLSTHASSIYGEDQRFLGSAVKQSSPFPQWMLNTSMQGKHQKSTFLSYAGPSYVPIHQPCQVPGAKLSSASIISFDDYGTNNAESRSSFQGAHPFLATILASKSVSAISPTCIGGLSDIDGRKGISFVDQRNKRPACADNVSPQPAKRQLVTDKLELTTPMVPNMKNHSFGWSLNDAVGPRILDFGNKFAGHRTQISRNEDANSRDSSGPIPVIETRSRAVKFDAGDKTMFRPGQNPNDHSKLLYSTKFSVDNGMNPVIL